MASTHYRVLRTLLDITDTTINAQETKNYQTTDNVTPNTIKSTALPSGAVAEAVQIEIYPPRAADGSYEDLREIWFTADSVDLRSFMQISGNGTSLMFPPHARVEGHRVVNLGEPFWKLAEMGLTRHYGPGNPVSNFPVRNSTIKYGSDLTLNVRSLKGVTGAGSKGWRVVVKGYVYTQSELALLEPGYANSVFMTDTRRVLDAKSPLSLPSAWIPKSGRVDLKGFLELLGGTQQAHTKAYPYVAFAYNGTATQATSQYIYSTNTQIGGAKGNVSDRYQDLGFQFDSGKEALLLRGFGIRPTSSKGFNVYAAGFSVNGEAIPTQGSGVDGIFVSSNVNPHVFGSAKPMLDIENYFYGMAKFPGGMLIYQDDAAIYTRSTAPDDADDIIVAANGVIFEGVEG